MRTVGVGGVDRSGNRFAGEQRSVNLFPDECPICHMKIVPELVSQGFVFFEQRLELYFRCTNSKCLRTFISLYGVDPTELVSGYYPFNFAGSVPTKPIARVFATGIEELSPTYAKIWTQAQAAESSGLDEIAGPGFRKALEFLVKDYAISLVTDKADKQKIKALALQAVIKNYLSGDKLPIVSSRAAWLGNDETHYERRWVGKDLQDLKKLIEATEHFIAMERLAASVPIEMPDTKAVAP